MHHTIYFNHWLIIYSYIHIQQAMIWLEPGRVKVKILLVWVKLKSNIMHLSIMLYYLSIRMSLILFFKKIIYYIIYGAKTGTLSFSTFSDREITSISILVLIDSQWIIQIKDPKFLNLILIRRNWVFIIS